MTGAPRKKCSRHLRCGRPLPRGQHAGRMCVTIGTAPSLRLDTGHTAGTRRSPRARSATVWFYSNTKGSVGRGCETISSGEKKSLISRLAVSGASDPCTRLKRVCIA
jgi:hypothetical protein